jgi:hypothetical protein
MNHQTFTANQILNFVETWLITGNLNESMLAEGFLFASPFWKGANKSEFLKQFGNPKSYQEVALSKITHFNPVIKLKDTDEKHIAVVLQYHTKNGNHVYETVFGTLKNGLLVELRSIYDLDETKKSLEL